MAASAAICPAAKALAEQRSSWYIASHSSLVGVLAQCSVVAEFVDLKYGRLCVGLAPGQHDFNCVEGLIGLCLIELSWPWLVGATRLIGPDYNLAPEELADQIAEIACRIVGAP